MRAELFTGPTAAELVVAVRELLDELRTEVPPERGFELRVAVNALRIVERELTSGGSAEAEHRARLEESGHAGDAELARAIRDGALPVDRALVERLLADATARVTVNSPRFVDGRTAER
jgi:hypothetical protein